MVTYMYVVIMAGGSGMRMWPKSRARRPKQFLKFFSNKTMLQETYSRIKGVVPFGHVLIVTPEMYVEEIKKELPEIPKENIIIEPVARSTAAAIGLSCIKLLKRDPNAVVSFLTSDDYVKEKVKFGKILTAASNMAKKRDVFVVWGVRPYCPSTGYGYVHSGEEVDRVDGFPFFEVRSFTEKPDLTTAQAFLASGKYFWNTCKFTQKAKVMQEAIKTHLPKLYDGLVKIDSVLDTDKETRVTEEVFSRLDSIAIEFGVMEKVKNIVMIPADLTWSDVGSWSSLYDLSPNTHGDTTLIGDESSEYIGIDTSGCLIHGSGRLIATIGVTDLVIVDTVDTILVCPKSRAQDVKKLLDLLKKKKRFEFL